MIYGCNKLKLKLIWKPVACLKSVKFLGYRGCVTGASFLGLEPYKQRIDCQSTGLRASTINPIIDNLGQPWTALRKGAYRPYKPLHTDPFY
jgi:hypothetical protein